MPLVNILHGRLTNALVKYETAKELRQCETTFLVNRSAVNYVTEW